MRRPTFFRLAEKCHVNQQHAIWLVGAGFWHVGVPFGMSARSGFNLCLAMIHQSCLTVVHCYQNFAMSAHMAHQL